MGRSSSLLQVSGRHAPSGEEGKERIQEKKTSESFLFYSKILSKRECSVQKQAETHSSPLHTDCIEPDGGF